MITDKSFVIDTVTVISYFKSFFKRPNKISLSSINIIREAFNYESQYRITIPSIVFVEIFEKWLIDEEMLTKFRREVFTPIIEAENFEIRSLDIEVLENFAKINDDKIKLENHDKIVLATAMTLNRPLITSDRKIRKFVKKYKVIPSIYY